MSETTLYPSTWPAYIWFSLVVGIPAVTFLYDFMKWFRMPPGPHSSALHRQQASAAQVETLGSVPRMVQNLRPHLHHLDRPPTYHYSIRPRRGLRAIGKTKQQVFLSATYGRCKCTDFLLSLALKEPIKQCRGSSQELDILPLSLLLYSPTDFK